MWPDEILDRVNKDIITNGALINSVNSEPWGSPSRGGMPTTTAQRTPRGWIINGRKRWASLAPALTYMLTLATIVDGDAPPRRGNFLVPASSPGVRVDETWDNLGMRGTASDDVVFTDVEVPLDALVPVDGRPFPATVSAGPPSAAPRSSSGSGRPRVMPRSSSPASGGPTGWTGPIAELQTIQHRIAAIELDLLQARTLLYATAEWWTERPQERPANMWRLAAAKYAVTNAVIRATDEALRVADRPGWPPPRRCSATSATRAPRSGSRRSKTWR